MNVSAPPAPAPRSILHDCIFLLLIAAVPAVLAGWLHPKRLEWSWNKPGVSEVNLDEVSRWPPPVLWIDARTDMAFEKQHMPGAVLLNEEEWEQRLPGFLEAWQPQSKVVVYCDSQACDASQAVALRLRRELNLSDIHVLKGGWAAWQKAHQ